MRSPLPRIERARPLLGTTVSIRVHGLSDARAHGAIDEAFGEIALIHRLMSFQEPDSDISRLNRAACERSQDVHPATFEVLHWAQKFAQASGGAFDITIAPKLVDWGILPMPQTRHRPDAEASWQDIELSDDFGVRFRRPLWIDVSGIAKGYAVDRAMGVLKRHGAIQAAVNAGGDLRIHGPEAERVLLQPEQAAEGVPVLEIENAAVASSSGHLERRGHAGDIRGPHVDGRSRQPVATNRFASVVAETCLVADALTKPVLILEEESATLLACYGALAHLHDPERGWRHMPEASA